MKVMLRCASAAMAVAIWQAPAAAQTVDAAAAFGARETIEDIALSPNGRLIAYLSPRSGQGSHLYVAEVGSTQPRQVTSVDGERQRLAGCDWVSNSRLVCTVYAVARLEGTPVTVSRLVSIDSDGTNFRQLGERDRPEQDGVRLWGGRVLDWLPGSENEVLMEQNFIPENRVSLVARSAQGLGVVRVNTVTGNAQVVEQPRQEASGFLADGRGQVRAMIAQDVRGATGRAAQTVNIFYRQAGGSQWVQLGEYNSVAGTGPWPAAVDGQQNALYFFEQAGGKQVLSRISLDGSGRREMVLSHDHVDVDGLLRLGRAQRVVGGTFATDRRQWVYFDPELRRLAEQFGRALPNTPLISFAGASEDERTLLIWAGSDTDPGSYYVYNRDTRQLNLVLLSRPELRGVQMAPMRAITYRAADGTEIPAYLTLPPGRDGRNIPAIVMPHGGPAARDEWGFDWLVQFYASQGFAVLQPNFRGSAGYGSEWFQINGFQSWQTAIGDVADAGRWLVSQGIADPDKLAVVGWSYGGYAALQSAATQPQLFKAVVAIAPVTDLRTARDEWQRFSNSANVRDYFGNGPHLVEGSPAQRASAITAPVLMFHGGVDRNVGISQARLMRDRLRAAGKTVELVEYPTLDHQLHDSAARTEMLRRSAAFLRQAIGM
ncbi:MAG: alpha/beta fold hydrolase [Allosphingosinicella sp.]|uniref:S9 family peptidase n=1 Tax=Allosphingosinicella sp. TaxID=2823234 RepID=UPI003929657C